MRNVKNSVFCNSKWLGSVILVGFYGFWPWCVAVRRNLTSPLFFPHEKTPRSIESGGLAAFGPHRHFAKDVWVSQVAGGLHSKFFFRATFPAAILAISRETMHVWTLIISTHRGGHAPIKSACQLSKLTSREAKNGWRTWLGPKKKAFGSRFDPQGPPPYPN